MSVRTKFIPDPRNWGLKLTTYFLIWGRLAHKIERQSLFLDEHPKVSRQVEQARSNSALPGS